MSRKKQEEKRSKRKKFLPRIIRSIVAIVLLSALILGIIIVVDKVSKMDSVSVSESVGSVLKSRSVDISKDGSKFILGGLLKRLTDRITSNSNSSILTDNGSSSTRNDNKNILYKVCIISDIHQDTTNLSKALEKVTDSSCMLLFVIGDLTNYGDVITLSSIKTILVNSGIKDFYVIPGDHDLAQSVNTNNFNNVFGSDYHFVEFADVRFLMLDNSANYTPVDKDQIAWMEKNIEIADFVVLSQPLYVENLNAPFNSIYMGSSKTPPDSADLKEKQEIVKNQGVSILDLIRNTNNVKAIISGEHHRSSEVIDPVRSSLKHCVIGAVTSTVNDYPQNIIQSSRFSVLTIYEDKSYFMEDVSID